MITDVNFFSSSKNCFCFVMLWFFFVGRIKELAEIVELMRLVLFMRSDR